jgi:hypothetical protein
MLDSLFLQALTEVLNAAANISPVIDKNLFYGHLCFWGLKNGKKLLTLSCVWKFT